MSISYLHAVCELINVAGYSAVTSIIIFNNIKLNNEVNV